MKFYDSIFNSSSIFLSLVLLLILCSFEANAQMEKVIESEAALYCKCSKILESKIKKSQAESVVKGKYQSGMKLFGGSNINLDLGKCLDDKRKGKAKKFLETLDETAFLKFRQEVRLVVTSKLKEAEM